VALYKNKLVYNLTTFTFQTFWDPNKFSAFCALILYCNKIKLWINDYYKKNTSSCFYSYHSAIFSCFRLNFVNLFGHVYIDILYTFCIDALSWDPLSDIIYIKFCSRSLYFTLIYFVFNLFLLKRNNNSFKRKITRYKTKYIQLKKRGTNLIY
jgi:hypothetical protein